MLMGSMVKSTVPAASANARSARPGLARATAGLGISTGLPRFLQAKLTIGQPGDPLEQQADQVAEQVMRMPESEAQTAHRRCAACGGDEPACPSCGAKQEMVSPKGDAAGGEAPASVGSVLRSSGEPLSRDARAFFEPRFGQDFSHVRVHQDQEARQSAREINALAYTVGSHIAFGAGRYEPATPSGRRLLAHELTHVMQQAPGVSAASAGRVQRQSGDPLKEMEGEQPMQAKVDECGKLDDPARVAVAPGVFVTVPDDTVKMSGPKVSPVGCPPGSLGNVVFTAGGPAWQMPASDHCALPGSNTKGIQVGYIQTVENCLSGGVYFKRDKANNWAWAGNQWHCVKNARDGTAKSKAPWYGEPGHFGPEAFGTFPALTDSPLVTLPSRQESTATPEGHKGGNPLRRMRIDGVFNVWLVAQVPGRPLVFVHNWTIQCFVVAMLKDDADPCHLLGWQIANMTKVTSSGPGKGSADPVLTGATANSLKTRC